MFKLEICRIGDELGVLLPDEMLARLKVKAGDTLHFSDTSDGAMRVTPYDPADFEKKMRIAEEGMARYRNTLRDLAK